MKDKVVSILNENRVMALATLRADGWPQNTMVGFANDDILLYFVISRESQKFRNIEGDDRVSIAIGRDFHHPASIRGLSIAAHASEVRDPRQREHALKTVMERHPALCQLEKPNFDHAAVMRACCSIITILDYSKGFGHTDLLTVGPGELTEMTPARDDDWGFGKSMKPLDDF
jgi:nitroimidazol reductase NimA-like FMN-containing flavoprotein (pyridoxamine 5'-phosphate oxidase superfamily)